MLAAVRSSLQHLRPWMHWAEGEIAPRNVEGFIDRVESGAERSFAIWDRRGSRFCGTCAINRIDEHHRTAKLGHWLRADATGRGLATRAARMVLIHGLQHMGLQRIEIVVSSANIPSQKVAERLADSPKKEHAEAHYRSATNVTTHASSSPSPLPTAGPLST